MIIRNAKQADLDSILHLFDDVQIWLVQAGYEGQWGAEPFSTNELQAQRFLDWIDNDIFYLLVDNSVIVGTLVINPEVPDYASKLCQNTSKQMFYLEAFATHPSIRRTASGKQLLDFAESEAQKSQIECLRLDCWAGNQKLRQYYINKGYQELTQFKVNSWDGVLFEKCGIEVIKQNMVE